MKILDNMPLIDSKTQELFIYIIYKLKEKPNFGSTVLNKALYFIDCESYFKTGKPVSSFAYIKQKFGPTPSPKQFLILRDKLVQSGQIDIVKTERFGRVQSRYVPNRRPVVILFTREEMSLIDEVLETICDTSATKISDLSHQLIAWKFARSSEELPFFTYLLTSKPINEDDTQWAESSIAQYEFMSNN